MARLLMLFVCVAFLHLVTSLAVRKDNDTQVPFDGDDCDNTSGSSSLFTTADPDRFDALK